MAQNDHQGRMQVFGGVLDTAQNHVVNDVSGHPDDKQVSKPLVKDDFRGYTRVGTAEDNGKGLLAFTHFDPALGRLMGVD
jgi:hypothetical protein